MLLLNWSMTPMHRARLVRLCDTVDQRLLANLRLIGSAFSCADNSGSI